MSFQSSLDFHHFNIFEDSRETEFPRQSLSDLFPTTQFKS